MTARRINPDIHCPTGKSPYTSAAAAREARHHLRSGDRLRIYNCPHCHHWHFTSNTNHRDANRRLNHQQHHA